MSDIGLKLGKRWLERIFLHLSHAGLSYFIWFHCRGTTNREGKFYMLNFHREAYPS